MKKPDLSKAAMSKFFLLHTEKLILGLSVLLLGLFFWMGFKAKPFADTTPKKLVELADQADQYIRSPTAWDDIKDARKGYKEVASDVLNNSLVNAAVYKKEPLTGSVAATLAPRKDPELFRIEFPEVQQFSAPLLIARGEMVIDIYSDFPMAGSLGPIAGGPAGGGGGRGPGGPGSPGGAGGSLGGMGGLGGDLGDEEDDYGSQGEDSGGGRGTSGGGRGTGGSRGKTAKSETEPPVLEDIGTQVLRVNSDTMGGIRPTVSGIPASTSKSYLYNVVVVSGVVDFKQQSKRFNDIFSEGIGYYPQRDKPIYQYLEVQRREVAADGTAGEWQDVSERSNFTVPRFWPQIHKLPKAMFPSAPDTVAADNYDPILTQPVPPVLLEDYTKYISHSKLAKGRTFPERLKEEEAKILGGFAVFGGGGSQQPGGNPGGGRGMGAPGGGRGTGAPGGAPGGGRGAGAPGGAPGGGRGSAPGGVGGGGRGSGPGGIGGGMGGGMGMGMDGGLEGGGGTGSADAVQTRMGSDFTDYFKALDKKTPTEDYRLVRFFDIFADAGKTYEYRMRAWVGDPNNEDPENTFVMLQGGGGGMLGGGMEGGLGGMGGMGRGGGGMGLGGMPGMGGRGSGIGGGGDEEGDYEGEEGEEGGIDGSGTRTSLAVKTTITSTMKDPSVRIRLNKTQEVKDPKNKSLVSYVVAEPRTDKDGNQIFEEVKVPKAPTTIDFNNKTVYSNYLKHARPTDWSDSVKVLVRREMSKVAGGEVAHPREVTIRNGNEARKVAIGEAQAEIAAATWWFGSDGAGNKIDYGTELPTKQMVSRGDALDFYTPSYFLHPISWQVLVAKNKVVTEGEGQYIVPIETGKVVVDLMGGEEIPLPRSEKMRHNLASEVLVMNEYGEFSVQNDMEDRTEFRNMLFQPDELQTVGKGRRPKKPKGNEMPGGGMGRDGEGDGGMDF